MHGPVDQNRTTFALYHHNGLTVLRPSESAEAAAATDENERKLAQLAQTQRMNTPLRKSIFSAIMTSEVSRQFDTQSCLTL